MESKKCEICKAKIGKLRKYCKPCASEINKESHRRYQQKHKETLKTKRKEKERENREYVSRDKEKGCQICGYSKSKKALHYHHLDASQKVSGISRMYYGTLKALKQEMDKCILLCSNCHHEVHDKDIESPL